MKPLVVILVAIALLAAVVGVVALTQATAGVGALVLACFLGILARLSQASRHQAELRGLLQSPQQRGATAPVAKAVTTTGSADGKPVEAMQDAQGRWICGACGHANSEYRPTCKECQALLVRAN